MLTTEAKVLTGGLRELFLRNDDRRSVRRRGVLHRGGDPLHHLWLVAHGWFARSRMASNGGEAFTAIYMPGDVIGLDAVLTGQLRDEVTALCDGVVCRVPLEGVRHETLTGGTPTLDAIGSLIADATFLREALFAVGTQSSVERLATFFLQTYARLRAGGIVPADEDRFALPLTQNQLGAITGLTSVHVNRVLKHLRTEGLLSFNGGVVHLIDAAGLRRAAHRRP